MSKIKIWSDHIVDHYFIFAIQTEEYSGNFERELCAYLTGDIGECGVGEEYAKRHEEEFSNEHYDTLQMPDEHGCYRPVSGGNYDDKYGVFIFFDSLNSKEIECLKSKLSSAEQIFNITILKSEVFEVSVNQDFIKHE